jgi:6-phosphogluconolactonase (cycloisomerase 2 family)
MRFRRNFLNVKNKAFAKVPGAFRRVRLFAVAVAVAAGFSKPAVARIYVADGGGSAVTAYSNSATGNAGPAATIKGGSTGISTPYGVAADRSHFYVTDIDNNSIQVYALTATGNFTPSARIRGDNTGLSFPYGVAVDANSIYVTNNNSNSVTIYPLGANGNNTPTATIVGADTGLLPNGIAVDANHIYVANSSSITVYPLTANGDAVPTATISGSNTGLTAPIGIAVDANHIYVTNANSILEFSLTANGNVAPTAVISGAGTGLVAPYGIAVNGSHILVTNDNTGHDSITEYALNATGNAAPTATITGSATGLETPLGIAIAPDPIPYTWLAPAAISYGTALSPAQLNLQTTVAGTVVYSQPSGTVLHPGMYALTATITPTDTVNYVPTTASVMLTVNKAEPTITWATPGAITYGTALSSTQLNATASSGGSPLDGTITYSPLSGTVPHGGSQTLTANFAPTDTTDYAATSTNVNLTVNKAAPVITWATPAAVTYGTALSGKQLDAVAKFNGSTVPGVFLYAPLSGTVPDGGSQTLGTTFSPTDTTDYLPVTTPATVMLTVNPATPVLTWPQPAEITYGTALSGIQLNAVAKANGGIVSGTYTYSETAGTVLHPYAYTLSVSFAPTNAADYNSATATAKLTVVKATPAITWATPGAITYGTALSGTQLDAVSTFNGAPVAGAFTYTPASGNVPGAGSQTLSAAFSPTDTKDYSAVTTPVTVMLTVNKAAAPTLTWAAPKAITYGTALSATQLDAVVKINGVAVAGTFTYSPASGTVLDAGSQTLDVTVTSPNFDTATSSTTLTVNKAAAPTLTWATPAAITYGTALSGAQLNATAKVNGTAVGGTFTYTPSSGTVPGSGSQKLSVTFVSTDYATATASTNLTVNKAIVALTWAQPAPIAYLTALSGTQLNAVAMANGSAVAGIFTYSPAAGTNLKPGSQTLSVTFVPTDTADYSPTSQTAKVSLTVNKAAPIMIWFTPKAITYGTALSSTQLDANAFLLPGTYVYTPAAGTVLQPGSQQLSVSFTPTDSADFASASATTTLTVNKVVPVITWATPAPVYYHTVLSDTQLNATATVNGAPAAGSFLYTPAAGTVALKSQALDASFTPTDSAHYASASASVNLTVYPPGAPRLTITIQIKGIGTINGVTVDSNYIYVAADSAILVYPINADSTTPPTAIITGDSTGLDSPRGIAVDSNNIYAENHGGNSVTVYPLWASGNFTPTAVIMGPSTDPDEPSNNTSLHQPYGITVDGANIYIANYYNNTILVFPLDGTGNIYPSRKIGGSNTQLGGPLGVAVNGGHIYASNYGTEDVTVFPLAANGNASPSAVIKGSNTGFATESLNSLAIDSKNIYVTCTLGAGDDHISVFPLTASGNVVPSILLGGTGTGINDPTGVAVDATRLYVANAAASTITIYLLTDLSNLPAP